MHIRYPRYPSTGENEVNGHDIEFKEHINYIEKYTLDLGAVVESQTYHISPEWGLIMRVLLLNIDPKSHAECRHTLVVWKQPGAMGFGAMDDYT